MLLTEKLFLVILALQMNFSFDHEASKYAKSRHNCYIINHYMNKMLLLACISFTAFIEIFPFAFL